MPPAVLPQELIELVVDEVGKDKDKTWRLAALQACSLTSWSFLTPARKHIFETVHLIEDGRVDDEKSLKQMQRLQDFVQLLSDDPCNAYSSQPHLSSHIRNLSIQLSEQRVYSNYEKPAANAECRLSSIRHILDLVPRVIGLSLSLGHSPWLDNASWPHVDTELKEALEVFCISHPLVRLTLTCITAFPISIVTQCHHPRSLSMRSIKEPEWKLPLHIAPEPASPSATPLVLPPLLEKLHITNSPEIMIRLIAYGMGSKKCPSLSSPRTLDIGLFSSSKAWLLIQSLPSLSHLRFRNPLTFGYPSIPATIDFGSLSNLKILEICCDFTHQVKDAGLLQLTRWKLFDPKETLMTSSSIESLVIHIGWSQCTRKKEARNFWPRSGWKTLDSVLSSDRFPRLRGIQLKLTVEYDRDPSVTDELSTSLGKDLTQTVQKKIRSLFPSLSRSSSARIDIDITAVVRSSNPYIPTLD